MIKRFFFICSVFALTQGIFSFAEAKENLKKSKLINKNPNAKPPSIAEKQQFERIHKLFSQMDEIYREAWWVFTNERRSQQGNIFSKMDRAAQTAMGMKVKNKSSFGMS
jgi:hypothetical protein